MGVGLTAGAVPELVVGQPELLDAEKEAMKDEISAALITYWDEMKTKSTTSTPSTQQEYADEFAEVLAETMYPRILDYVIANANFTATTLGGVIATNTITVTPTVTVTLT